MHLGIARVGVASASLPRDRLLPVLPALRDFFPYGGLQRGSVVSVPSGGLLSLAIAAAASAAGAWCAVVGRPEFGVRAALSVGVEPGRLLLVGAPGERWPQVTAALLDGCEVVLICPPAQPAAHVKRHVEATLRRAGGLLVVAGDWPGAQARLWVARQQWAGVGQGHGRLTGRLAQVLATGRGAATRPAQRWLWLPGPDGSVAAADPGISGLAAPALAGTALAGPALAAPGLAGPALAAPGLAGPALADIELAVGETGPGLLAVRAG